MAGPGTASPASPSAAPPPAQKKPEEAKGVPAPKSTGGKTKVPVQFYAIRLFARHVGQLKAGSFEFIGNPLAIGGSTRIELSHAVPEAAVFVKTFLADKDFVTVKTTTGKGRARRTVESLGKITGKVKLTVADKDHYGLVQRKTAGGKVVDTAPAAELMVDVTNGESAIGSPTNNVVLIRALKASGNDPKNIPLTAPGPESSLSAEVVSFQDEKKNAVSKDQVDAEHSAASAPITWPVTSTAGVSPELPHQRWPSEDSLDVLHEKFRENVNAFFDALKAIKVGTGKLMSNIGINSVFRSPQHAYLFCWSWRIAKGENAITDPPEFLDADGLPDPEFPLVDWRLSKTYAKIHRFLNSITAFYAPPKRTTNHLRRVAVDCNMPVNITAKVDCTIKLPTTYWKLTKKTETDGKVTIEAEEGKNTETEKTFSLEPNDGANGWVAIQSKEYVVQQISKASVLDVRTYRAGKDKTTDFTIDVRSIKLTAAEEAEIRKTVTEELTESGEAELQEAIEKQTEKEVAAVEAKRIRDEEKKRKAARPKKPPLTQPEKDALKLTEEEKKNIRENVEKRLRPPHEKALNKKIDAETKARIAAETRKRRDAEHDKQLAEKKPKAEQKAKDNATSRRQHDANFFKHLHAIGKDHFGVVHHSLFPEEAMHWSYNGG